MKASRYPYHEHKHVVLARHVPLVAGILHQQLAGTDPYPESVVESVYYDTIDGRMLAECKDGSRLKTKLRVRRYGDEARGVLQIKQRQHTEVRKLTSPVNWPTTPWPTWPSSTNAALNAIARGFPALRPVVRVRYVRRRYRFADTRVTFDTSIVGEAQFGLRAPAMSRAVFPGAVVEIKTLNPVSRLPPGIRGWVQLQSLSKFGILLRALQGEPAVLNKYAPRGRT